MEVLQGHADRGTWGRARGGPRLPAKLTVRRAVGAIDRERLFAELDAAPDAALVWIQGPAGAGKSTLVAGWLARRDVPALWYHVDPDDADPATVFSYLALGASALTRKKRLSLPVLTPEFRLDQAGFARRFFRLCFEALPPRAALVFDGLEGARGVGMAEILLAAHGELPPDGRLIVTSRDTVPPPLAHLRASGMMTVVDGQALSLTLDEAKALAGPADETVVRRVHEATHGWAAGFVVLLAQPRRDVPDGAGPVAERLFPYYLQELLVRADVPVRTLLLHTSALPGFTAAQAAALTGIDDAEAILGSLLKRHFFLDSGGSEPCVYRYHPLFRDFLCHRAREELGPASWRAVLVRGAELLLAGGEDEAALALLIEAGARDQAVALACQLAPRLLRQGRIATLGQILGALGSGTSEAEHALGFWRGMAMLAVAPQRARADFEAAYAGFAARGDVVGQLGACAAMLDSYLYGWGDMREVDHWAEVLEPLWRGCGDRLPPELQVRVLSSFAVLIIRGHRHAALVDAACERAQALLEQITEPVLQLTLTALVLLTRYLRGQWRDGLRYLDFVEPLLPAPAVQPQAWVFVQAMKARMLVWDGRADAAFAVTERAQAIAEANNVRALVTLTASAAVFAALNIDDLGRAEAWLARMRAGLLPGRRLDVATIDLQQGLLALARGEAARAASELRAAVDAAAREGADLLVAQFRLPLALSLIMTGAPPADVEGVLKAVADYAAAARTPMLEHGAHLVGAWLAVRGGDEARALRRLRQALALGREHDWYVVFPWAPRAMLQDVCLLALRHGLETASVRELIRRRGVPPPRQDADEWPWRLRVYTLGRFDLEVDGRTFAPAAKAPKKPLELLRAVIAAPGPSGIATATLHDQLWPDLDGDAAHDSLTSALHRLRRLLGDDNAVVLSEGRLRLDRERIWVDVLSLERLAERAADDSANASLVDALLARYRGDFLPDEAAPWALVARNRIRSHFLRAATALAERLESRGRLEETAALAQRVIEVDPVAEALHRALMRCLRGLGRNAEALDAYRRCESMLSTLLGTRPSAQTLTLLAQIRGSTDGR